MKLDKKLVDEVFRLTKKYYKTSDMNYLDALWEAKKALKEKATWREVDLLCDLARYEQVSGKATNEDIYKALEVFGIIVEEEQEWK